jgi:hypothetical protein
VKAKSCGGMNSNPEKWTIFHPLSSYHAQTKYYRKQLTPLAEKGVPNELMLLISEFATARVSGEIVDVRDCKGNWCIARMNKNNDNNIVDNNNSGDFVDLHFIGWMRGFDVRLHRSSYRIAPKFSMTKEVKVSPSSCSSTTHYSGIAMSELQQLGYSSGLLDKLLCSCSNMKERIALINVLIMAVEVEDLQIPKVVLQMYKSIKRDANAY